METVARETIKLSWPDLQEIVTQVASEIRLGGVPQILIAISRGGLVPAVILSHLLDVRDVRVLTIIHTVDDQVYAAKTATAQVCRPETLGVLDGADVLLVDDIVGSGKTLAAACTDVTAHGPGRIRSAALTANAARWPDDRPGRPDHIGMLVRSWVVFPWERSAI
jgi:hypoxanthine phosphoribosyltransferase